MKGLRFDVSADGKGVVAQANQPGVSGELLATINGILGNPGHEQLQSVMKEYVGQAQALADELKRATGLSDADWAEILAAGGSLTDNEGMRSLLDHDPDLAAALDTLFHGGTGLFAATQRASSREEADTVALALGTAIQSVLKNARVNFGMNDREVAELMRNLSVRVGSDGTFSVEGTANSKLISMIGDYVENYTSGVFAQRLAMGETLNQALGGGAAGGGTSFTFTFAGGRPAIGCQYGDGDLRRIR